MTRNDTAEMIDRYLFAVGEMLPRAQRDDITRELRTLIEDKLEERGHAPGQPVESALAVAVLQEIGEPGVVARRYDTRPQYLVGPRFYPVFLRIAKIGLALIALVVLVTTLLSSAADASGAAPAFGFVTLWGMLGNYIQMAIGLFAWTVLVLAILERTRLGRKVPCAKWDPRDLPPLPEASEPRVSAPELAVEICLVVVVLAVLNFAPEWIGVLMVRSDSGPGFTRLTEFGVHLPVLAINVWLAVALLLKVVVLGQRRWTAVTRWLEVAVGLMAAGVLFLIVARSSLHGPPGLPQVDPALSILGRLLYIAPCAVLLQPVLRIIRLVRAPGPRQTARLDAP